MAKALFDTTFFVDLHRGDAGAAAVWSQVSSGQLSASYSPITVFELWLSRGITFSEEAFYRGVFRLLRLAPLTSTASKQAGMWIRSIPTALPEAITRDALIAATAHARSEAVYTRNVRDFSRFVSAIVRY